jgi:sialic acid synthase SpsE
MRRLVAQIRETEIAMGNGIKQPAASEVRNMAGMRRSIVARRDIRQGMPIVPADLILKRPLSGIPPSAWDQVIGRTTKYTIAEGKALAWDDLEGGAT